MGKNDEYTILKKEKTANQQAKNTLNLNGIQINAIANTILPNSNNVHNLKGIMVSNSGQSAVR